MSTGKTKYYVLKEKAVPEVLLKVIEAKKLMETGHPDKVKNQYGIWDYRNPQEPYHPERSV